jgi:hypothetical protein
MQNTSDAVPSSEVRSSETATSTTVLAGSGDKIFVSDMFDTAAVPSVRSSTTLEKAEIAGRRLLREEEKLARDVYLALGERWDMPIFFNIAASEETHTAAVAELLRRYDIPDPASSTARAEFRDSELQTLYDELVAQGSQSLEDALIVGAQVEELDIYDLEKLLQNTDESAIVTVYENVQKGSRNHLRAFARQHTRRNITYAPKHLTAQVYADIINSPQERNRIEGP